MTVTPLAARSDDNLLPDSLDALDAETFNLSGKDFLDDLNFTFDEDACSGGPIDLDCHLLRGSVQSLGSAMDLQCESLRSSLDGMRIDAAQEEGASGGRRERPPSPAKKAGPRKHARARLADAEIDFDPPGPAARKVSDDGPPAASSPSNAAGAARIRAPPRQYTQSEYGEALSNLADSMRRTQESRRHVMAWRDALAPEQRRALSLARERLALENRRVQASIAGGFLQGSLEQGRKNLCSYVGRVDLQTL